MGLFALFPGHAAALTRHYTQALSAIAPADTARAGPPAPDSPDWKPIALPDVVLRPVAVHDDTQKHARAMAWYVFTWQALPAANVAAPAASAVPGTPTVVPIALYVPRAISGPLQVWYYQAGRWRLAFDNRAWAAEQWNRPLLVQLPADAVSPGQNLRLAVGAPHVVSRFRALSTVWIGPLDELRPRADLRATLHLTLPEAASLAMLTLGLLSLAVWNYRRHESVYLYFAAASIMWPLRNLHHFVNLPKDPQLSAWFWWMTGASVSWVMLAMYFFAFRFDRRRLPKVERAFVGFVLLTGVLTLPIWNYDSLLLQHAANLVAALLVTVLLSVLAWRGGSHELRVIVAALWASFAFAVHDWLLVAMLITPESIYLLPCGSMLVIASYLYAAMRRYLGAIEQVESANTRLAATLAQREGELESKHLQLRQIEREQAVLLERQRLMRDMHDGVGSTLIATLRVVEAGEYSREGVAELLHMAIEDLRLSIDSLEPIEHDLTTLLATLRTRVGRRLEGAGLRLQWQMDNLPPLPWLDPGRSLQILRLLQEALSNVIKHAQATHITISATQAGGEVLVCVSDNGRGFDPTMASPGRGIPGMRLRAEQLGGALEVESSPSTGSKVTIRLPLEVAPALQVQSGPVLVSAHESPTPH